LRFDTVVAVNYVARGFEFRLVVFKTAPTLFLNEICHVIRKFCIKMLSYVDARMCFRGRLNVT
jgi:hypothetical protein